MEINIVSSEVIKNFIEGQIVQCEETIAYWSDKNVIVDEDKRASTIEHQRKLMCRYKQMINSRSA